MAYIELFNKYKKITSTDLYDNIKNNNNKLFKLNINSIDTIVKTLDNTIKKYDEYETVSKTMLFVIVHILKNGYISPFNSSDCKGGVPKYGFEFTNQQRVKRKNKDVSIGIYHAHLSDLNSSVLLWYPIRNNDNTITLHFDYVAPHPNDNYETLLNEIYNRNDSGYNFDISIDDYFTKSLKNLMNTKNETIIYRFGEFVSNAF